MTSKVSEYFTTLLFALLLFPLLGCARDELPSFDSQKAAQLSPEKRREYDVIFFNEIAVWNMNSNRYSQAPGAPFIERDAEFRRMAADGYLPAYVALRLLNIKRGSERNDPEAVAILVKAAEDGDASAMCAISAIPLFQTIKSDEERITLKKKMAEAGVVLRHPACLARKGAGYLLHGDQGELRESKEAMPFLLDTASQGYYSPAYLLFSLRYGKALRKKFDFSNQKELKRTLCWGRLAEQHTNWAGFDHFLGLLRDYARANDRPDLVEISFPYDPRLVPITQTVVKPEDCIQLEG
ncbi:MAG: hypothetical protein ABII63_00355 [Pseudomonadota bacterium]